MLDLCCGPGRHSLELARRGYIVKGVDRTAKYLESARAKAAAEGLTNAEFVSGDMRTYREPMSFDLVLNLFTSFGYFDNQSEDAAVMRNIYSSLRPGGKMVLDVLGKEVLAAKFRPRDWHEQGSVMFLEERVLSRDWGWIEDRWIRIDGGERTEFTLSHRLYSAAELRTLVLTAGFAEVGAYGSLEGIPYDHRARRLVVVAHKGATMPTATG